MQISHEKYKTLRVDNKDDLFIDIYFHVLFPIKNVYRLHYEFAYSAN